MNYRKPLAALLTAIALALPLVATSPAFAQMAEYSTRVRFDDVPVKDIVQFVLSREKNLNIVIDESVGELMITMHRDKATMLEIVEGLHDQVTTDGEHKIRVRGDVQSGDQIYRISAEQWEAPETDFDPYGGMPGLSGVEYGGGYGGGAMPGGVAHHTQVQTRMLEFEMTEEDQQVMLELLDEVIAAMPEHQRPEVKLHAKTNTVISVGRTEGLSTVSSFLSQWEARLQNQQAKLKNEERNNDIGRQAQQAEVDRMTKQLAEAVAEANSLRQAILQYGQNVISKQELLDAAK